MLFTALTAIVFALHRSINGDFYPINGDFQNYNIFRRLLDGQVQYKDFTNYLGNGMVFINYPLIRLFDSFGESVFITYFTTSILYSFILCILLYTVIHKRKKVYFITNVIAITAFIALRTLYGTFYYKYVYDVFAFEETVSSVRTTRAFLPFMLVGIFYIIKRSVIKNRKKESLLPLFLKTGKSTAGIFFVVGVLTVWSNDYGYSCMICSFIIMLMINLFGEKMPFVKRIGIYFVAVCSAVAGMAVSIMLISHGHITDYVSVNAGIADYQWWYYTNTYDKFLTVSDIFSDGKYVVLTVVFFLHGIGFLVKTIKHKIKDDDICRLFLHSTCYGASLIYAVGTGAHYYVPVVLVTYVYVMGLFVKVIRVAAAYILSFDMGNFCSFFKRIERAVNAPVQMLNRNRTVIYIHIMLLLYCFAVNIIRINVSYQDKSRVEGLNVSSIVGQGLDEKAEAVADEMIFSTYAGALEIINGVFQPTGVDYIIHALGDSRRNMYLENFIEGKYRYVSTPKNEYTEWEYWSSRVNWYFYRELYQRYVPADETNYSVIWEETEKKNTVETDIRINYEYVNGTTCRIDVELPDYTDGAYVDLFIKYDTEWTEDRLKKGGLRKVLCVEDGGEQYTGYMANSCYYLRGQSDGCEIPVYVRDGKGSVYISSYPMSCTKLIVAEAVSNMIIAEPDFPLHVTGYKDISFGFAYDGVDQTGTLLKFDNTEFNMTKLEVAEQIKANGEIGVVNSVWNDGAYIYVLLDDPVERENFLYPNVIDVVEKKEALEDE